MSNKATSLEQLRSASLEIRELLLAVIDAAAQDVADLREYVDKRPGGGSSAQEAYSTEETRIGTWIDGKPLYRRVITDMVLPDAANTTASYSQYGINALGIDTVVSYSVMHRTNAGSYAILPFVNFGNDVATFTHFQASITGSAFTISTRGTSTSSSWFGKPVTAILEYTKTTD